MFFWFLGLSFVLVLVVFDSPLLDYRLVMVGSVLPWLDRLWARNGWLSIGRKRPVPHESWFAVAGYFYYFGHYYAGYCIELLPEDRQRRHKDHLAAILLSHQEKDGSWFDYPLYDYGHPYGTGFALATLLRCRHEEK